MKKIGDHITYIDPRGVAHEALTTAIWSETCVNLVYVSLDANEKDDYGQQIKRETSVVHKSLQSSPGQYWE
jgi:hypothetical protein